MTRLFAADAAGDESRAWQAFEASERGRARSLRYAMNQMESTDTAKNEPDTERFQQLMQRISQLAAAQSAEAPQIALDSLAEIARPGDATDNADSRNLLRQRLAALDASAIEYAVGRDDMYAFVIDGAGISVTRLGKTRDIGAAAENLYDKVRNRESAYGDVRRAAAKLAELVLWPISAKLTHRRVVVVPDDSLHTVPFGVLPWSRDTDAPLLLERAELSVVPSTLFVTHPRSQTARLGGSPRLDLIGDPVFTASRWERECANAPSAAVAQPVALNRRSLPGLPGSRKEVLAIERLAQARFGVDPREQATGMRRHALGTAGRGGIEPRSAPHRHARLCGCVSTETFGPGADAGLADQWRSVNRGPAGYPQHARRVAARRAECMRHVSRPVASRRRRARTRAGFPASGRGVGGRQLLANSR